MSNKSKILFGLFFAIILVSIGTSTWYIMEEKEFTPEYIEGKKTPSVTWPVLKPMNEGDDPVEQTKGTAKDGVTEVNGTFIYDTSTSVFTTGTATVTTVDIPARFVPTDTNKYEEVTGTIKVTLNAVAYIGSTYYGTVEKALNDLNTGGNKTAYIVIGSNPTIRQSCKIANGKTLSIPYEGTLTINREGTNQNYADCNASEVAKNLKTNVYINDNVTLTVDSGAQLHIGGIIGSNGGRLEGHTSGSYTQITLGANAKLISNGTINCFGYIKEDTWDNGSYVDIVSGTVNMPFVVQDFRGGTYTVTVYRKGSIAPFSIYEMPNIQPKFKIRSGSRIVGYVDLYASKKHNTSEINIIGPSGSILNVTSGYLETHYKPVNHGYTIIDRGTTGNDSLIYLDLYGDGNLGPMSIKVQGVTVTTKSVFFGISYKYQCTLHSGTFRIPNHYKFMNGSSFTVNKGATLQVDGDLIFYQQFKDVAFAGTAYPNKPAAKLTVNGKMVVNNGAEFGGLIDTIGSGAELNIVNGAQVKLTSIEGNSGSTNSVEALLNTGEFIVTNRVSEDATGLIYHSGRDPRPISNGTYYSKDSSWYSDNLEISYDLNGGTSESIPNSPSKVVGSNGYTIKESDITTAVPTRPHFEFGGWYVDREGTIPAVGYVAFANVKLFAKWIPIDYNITYEDVYYDNFTTGQTSDNPNNPLTFNYNTNVLLQEPTNKDYSFGGWYLDKACTQRITSLNGEDLVNSLNGNSITLYAKWYPAGSLEYVVYYTPNNAQAECQASDTIIVPSGADANAILAQWALANFDKYNEDLSFNRYFVGWYITDSTQIIKDLTASMFNEAHELTLQAFWDDKITVNFNHELNGSMVSQDIYFIPANDYGIPSNFRLPAITSYAPVKGERMVWFVNDTFNSPEFYIGGKDYPNMRADMTVYGEFYYVIDQAMFNSKTPITGHTNIAFDTVVFTYLDMLVTAGIHKDDGIHNIAKRTNYTPTVYSDNNQVQKIAFNNSTLLNIKSGITYHYYEEKFGWGVGWRYALAYNGPFNNMVTLTQVVCHNTLITPQTFSNTAKLDMANIFNDSNMTYNKDVICPKDYIEYVVENKPPIAGIDIK